MLNYIYDWMENIAFYLVILVAVMQMIPKNSYQKYIRFFAGMILILMLTGPIIKLFGVTDFKSIEYQSAFQEIEDAGGYIEHIIGKEGCGGE